MNRLNKAAGVLTMGGVLLLANAARAADDSSYLFLDGYGVHNQNRVSKSQNTWGARLGGGLPINDDGTSVELGLFGNSIRNAANVSAGQRGLMLDVLQAFGRDRTKPFVFGGLGGVREKVGTIKGTYPAAELGLGMLFGSEDVKFRASVSEQAVFNKDVNPNKKTYFDTRFNVGMMIPFGSAKVVPPPPVRELAPPPPPPPPPAPPKDSDGDGVPDDQDLCPGTLPGTKVDAHGCAIESATIVLKGVTFVSGSAVLTPEAKGALDKAATALAGQPNMKVEIGGHTDALGDAKKNVALSQARADSVRKHLIGKGIDAARLTAKGYGSAHPLASNKTKEGRAENRRVELKVIK